MRTRVAASHAAAVCWFLLYAVVVSYPLIVRLDNHVPGTGAGDNVAFLWNFWWVRRALAEPALSVFYTDHLFAPFGTSLVLHTHTALPAWLGATLLAPLQTITAHNVVLLLGLAANGIATYALAYRVTRRSLAAVLGGVIFAGSAYVSIRLLGHFNLVHAWVLPVACLSSIRCLEAPAWGRGVAAGAALAAAAYTDYYYFVYAVIFAAGWGLLSIWTPRARWGPPRLPRVERGLGLLVVLVAALTAAILLTGGFAFNLGAWRISASRVRNPAAALWILSLGLLALRLRWSVERARDRREPGSAAAVGAAVVTFALLIFPLAIPAARLIGSGGYVSPPHTWRSSPGGIDLATMVLGNPFNVTYGANTRAFYDTLRIDVMEQTGWLGLAPLLLIVTLRRTVFADGPARRWALVGLFFFLWSLGPFLLIGGSDTGIPLPHWVGRFVPLLSNARIPGRAFVMVQLAAAVLSAMAVARLRWPRWAVLGAITIALLDGAAGSRAMFALPPGGAIEAALARSGGRTVVLEMPVGLRDGFGEAGRFDHRALVFQMSHGQPIAGGFVARLSPRVRRAYEQSSTFVSMLRLSADGRPAGDWSGPVGLAAGLRALGITHVVVNTDGFDKPPGHALEAAGLRRVLTAGPRELYTTSGS
jgi:hypothetical protein